MNNAYPLLAMCSSALLACGSSSPTSSPAGSPAPPTPSATAPTPDAMASNGTAPDTFATSMGLLRVTPIWHGTVALSVGEMTIVVDPWSQAPAGRLPKADLVLLTDIHPDHLDTKALETVRKAGTVFIGPSAVAKSFPETRILDNGQELTELGIGIRAMPMYNVKRGPEPGKLFHDKGRGNGYLLSIGGTHIYVSGDTECTEEMRALEDIDLAFVSMNLPYTMPPEEAAECIKAFRPTVVIPYHYRGSDLSVLEKILAGLEDVEVRLMDFYAEVP